MHTEEPDFAELLGPQRLLELEANVHTVIGLRPDNRIGYRNQGWNRFARENGAPELEHWSGPPIPEVFPDPLRDFYEQLFDRVRDTTKPADHRYQCSSPDLYREFHLRVLPLPDRHLLLIHHLVVEQDHTWDPHQPGSRYVDAHGIITQCCHCRRVRRVDGPQTWDWVPAYLDRRLDNISHGLCAPCFRHYHPNAAAKRDLTQ